MSLEMPLFNLQQKGNPSDAIPLAAKMRPQSLSDFVGQEHLLGKGKVLRRCIETNCLPSMILWGPPGSGKTSLACIIAQNTESHFSSLTAVSAGVADLRRITSEAKQRLKLSGQRTILFIDEIHRFNKAQQDAVLPFVENGTVILIGATTENPSFEVVSPLLSRCRVFQLNLLTNKQVRFIVERALKNSEQGLGTLEVTIDEEALDNLVNMSNGDARIALNVLEMAVSITLPDSNGNRRIKLPDVEDALQHRALPYDKSGDQHYDIMSALHKSLRGSDPDAALYWLGRMIESGEEPLYIARRLVRFASEDVGMADPQALLLAIAAQQAVHFVGMPEANLALVEAVVFLASAHKSNSLYQAYSRVKQDIEHSRNEPVPLWLRNPKTSLMRQMGYGQGYKYAHDHPGHFIKQQYLPHSLKGKHYYIPSDQGYEVEVDARLKAWWGKHLL
ncbi:MAG: replication-associated recombination protein A [Dehalococcoidia bacterium]|nr:replication-associated recombination protein A [Dehalococcoidia bacterium]